MGIEIPEEDCLSGRFWESGKFTYKKDFGRYKEYEIDHVFIWKTDSVLLCLIPDKTEISEILWIDILELINWIELRPDEFTVWFLPALKQFFSDTEVHISKPLFDDISW